MPGRPQKLDQEVKWGKASSHPSIPLTNSLDLESADEVLRVGPSTAIRNWAPSWRPGRDQHLGSQSHPFFVGKKARLQCVFGLLRFSMDGLCWFLAGKVKSSPFLTDKRLADGNLANLVVSRSVISWEIKGMISSKMASYGKAL